MLFLQARAVDGGAGGAARVLDQFLFLAQLDFRALDVQFGGEHVFAGHRAALAQGGEALELDLRGLQVQREQLDRAGELLVFLVHFLGERDDLVFLLRQLLLETVDGEQDRVVVELDQ
jgi:hypothetical protein